MVDVNPQDTQSQPPLSPLRIRAPTSRSKSLEARTHSFNLFSSIKETKQRNAVNHSHFNRSSVVWSHDAHPPNVVQPSFERSTFFCTLYNAKPWRSAQLVFYSECQFHQSLDSSLQQSGIFSVHLFFHSIFTWYGNACCWSVGAAIRSPCFLLQCILNAFFVGEILGQSSHL